MASSSFNANQPKLRSSILYHCACLDQQPSSSKPPPAMEPMCDVVHHPLTNLFFCEDCDAIRCNRCVTCEVSCYYCPNCLFEVPNASVRGDKNRCSRNCFLCPECSNTLSVVASDPDPSHHNRLPSPSVAAPSPQPQSSSADPASPGEGVGESSSSPPLSKTPSQGQQARGGGFPELTSAAASVGEPPYYLACNYCRWNSKEVGITFEKATGLTLQLQKSEDTAPEILEFDHLKDHLEPFVRQGMQQASNSSSSGGGGGSSSSHGHGGGGGGGGTSPAMSAASAALSNSILKESRYGSLFGMARRAGYGLDGGGHGGRIASGYGFGGGGGGAGAGGWKEELDPYEAVFPAGGENGRYKEEKERVEFMRDLKDLDEVAGLNQRWGWSWGQPIKAVDLKPQRIPLLSKKTKRCPTCKHILIKPEQKAQSVKYRIKLVASNYLPSIDLYRRPPPTIGSRLSAASTASGLRRAQRTTAGGKLDVGGDGEEPLRPGRTYVFELSFTNPLYEPIHVKIGIARPPPSTQGQGRSNSTATSTTSMSPVEQPGSNIKGSQEHRRSGSGSGNHQLLAPSGPPFSINIPTPSFPIAAFQETWEFEDQMEDLGDEDGGGDESMGGVLSSKRKKSGVVEKKGNRTTIIMELTPGREAVGPIRLNMLVTYTYQSDEGGDLDDKDGNGESKSDETKSFSFWTLVSLGTVQPRSEETKRRMAAASGSAG